MICAICHRRLAGVDVAGRWVWIHEGAPTLTHWAAPMRPRGGPS